ncbi:CvpA family protein [Pseudofulvibacter geojedonensis]|uniref:CvpA family protein n=1 Tax=Pseudofulvibacter geojedonensis TaxID=1123758 RepID=A0ABW3I0Y3_9FLAO
MNTIDIVLGALILFGVVRGFMKGLFVEVASLVALIAGVYGAIHFSGFMGRFLETKTDWDEKTINVVAFAITFVVIVLLIALAGKAFTKLADFAALGMLNKILGAVFGGLKIGLILSVILIVFSHLNNTITFIKKEQIQESILYEPVKKLAPLIFPKLIKQDIEGEEEDLETTPEETIGV